MSLSISISESEILDALREVGGLSPGRPEGAFTTRELAAAWGIDTTTVQRRIKPLILTGRMECVRIIEIDIAGRPQQTPAYRLVAQPKKKAKR